MIKQQREERIERKKKGGSKSQKGSSKECKATKRRRGNGKEEALREMTNSGVRTWAWGPRESYARGGGAQEVEEVDVEEVELAEEEDAEEVKLVEEEDVEEAELAEEEVELVEEEDVEEVGVWAVLEAMVSAREMVEKDQTARVPAESRRRRRRGPRRRSRQQVTEKQEASQRLRRGLR